MNERADVDSILKELETKLSKKIDSFISDPHLEMIISEKDQEIARLRTLPENKEILNHLREMEAIRTSMAFRFAESTRKVLFGNPLTRRIIYHMRKWL